MSVKKLCTSTYIYTHPHYPYQNTTTVYAETPPCTWLLSVMRSTVKRGSGFWVLCMSQYCSQFSVSMSVSDLKRNTPAEGGLKNPRKPSDVQWKSSLHLKNCQTPGRSYFLSHLQLFGQVDAKRSYPSILLHKMSSYHSYNNRPTIWC